MITTYSTHELPVYEYIPISNEVLIRINQFDHEETYTDEGTKEKFTQLVYNTNEFRVPLGEITEEEVAADPMSFLNYSTTEYSLRERIEAIEEAIDYILMGGM